MSEFIPLSGILVSAALGLAAGHVSSFFRGKTEVSVRRTAELAEAARTLSEHFEELKKFVSSAEAPEALKEILLNFSELAGDKERAVSFVNGYLSHINERKSISEATQIALREIESLRVRRPDLLESFEKSIGSGFVALLLRWPETAVVNSVAMSQIVSDRYKEIDFATSLAHSKTSPKKLAFA